MNGTTSRMLSHNNWLAKHTKSILVEKTIIVNGSRVHSDNHVPITLTVKAIELDYGPVIAFSVSIDTPFKNIDDWDDHPFMYNDLESPILVANTVEDTCAVRALIDELVAEPKNMYTTTDCTHRGRLIKAIMGFWS